MTGPRRVEISGVESHTSPLGGGPGQANGAGWPDAAGDSANLVECLKQPVVHHFP